MTAWTAWALDPDSDDVRFEEVDDARHPDLRWRRAKTLTAADFLTKELPEYAPDDVLVMHHEALGVDAALRGGRRPLPLAHGAPVKALLLLAYGALCVAEFLVTWAKERVSKALKDPPPPPETP